MAINNWRNPDFIWFGNHNSVKARMEYNYQVVIGKLCKLYNEILENCISSKEVEI